MTSIFTGLAMRARSSLRKLCAKRPQKRDHAEHVAQLVVLPNDEDALDRSAGGGGETRERRKSRSREAAAAFEGSFECKGIPAIMIAGSGGFVGILFLRGEVLEVRVADVPERGSGLVSGRATIL